MEKKIIRGVIYSKFHPRIGPNAFLTFPHDLNSKIKKEVSIKTINIVLDKKGKVPQSLAILPFGVENLKGIVKSFELKDDDQRGGVIDGSITLIFNETHDSIFYKYLQNLEPIFNDIATKIIELEAEKAEKKIISNELLSFYSKTSHLINELYDIEFSSIEQEPFPSSIKKTEHDFRFKIIVCGDPSVGKTSIILRFTDQSFKRVYIPTLGVNISEKKIKLEKVNIIFSIWDIAGQSKFQSIRDYFYEGANAYIVVFDLTKRNTFNHVADWQNDVERIFKGGIVGFIVGNKNDLTHMREISSEEIQKLAKSLDIPYIETSALNGHNIDELFFEIGRILSYNYS